MTTLILAIGLFAGCFLLMGIGLLIRGAVLKGSCGGAAAFLGEDPNCGCVKKERELCPSDDDTGLLKLSNIANPQRTLHERDRTPGYDV